MGNFAVGSRQLVSQLVAITTFLSPPDKSLYYILASIACGSIMIDMGNILKLTSRTD